MFIPHKCLKLDCKKILEGGQLYCLEHRPDNFEVTGPDGKLIRWKNHPDYAKVQAELKKAEQTPPSGG